MSLFVRSGGQTGVDRGALDAALAAGVPCGGWCPEGRLAEDGIIPARYPVRELPGAGYPERTRRNLQDADATLILHFGVVEGGTALTRRLCKQEGRPVLVLDLGAENETAGQRLAAFVREHAVADLNVAGPRESKAPGARVRTAAFLQDLLPGLR